MEKIKNGIFENGWIGCFGARTGLLVAVPVPCSAVMVQGYLQVL